MHCDFAPMEGVTGYVYRNLHRAVFGGADRYYLPFVSVGQSRAFSRREWQDLCPEHNTAGDLVPQLLGKDAEGFIWAARALRERGYKEINLNLGCPSGTVVAKGKGAGLLADPPALERLLDFQLQNGTDAVVVCGTTGESSTMSYRERMRTIEFCVEYVAGRVPVIAGSGSNSTENAVILSRDAQRSGADALLVVTPYYNKATQAGLIRHYTTLADAVSCPVILYNVPSRTGVNIAPETCARLAEHRNILGIKEASGDLGAVQRIRRLCPPDFYIWSGNDDETVPICALGGKGVISVAANVVPAQMHRLVELCLQNDFAAAGELQIALKPLCDALFCEVNPIPVKTALNLMGWEAGPLRLPLCQPSEEHLQLIQTTLAEYGLIPES